MESGFCKFEDGISSLFAPGDIYWERLDGRRVCILKYGCLVRRKFLKRFKKLIYQDSVDHDAVEALRSILKDLKNAIFMPDKIKARKALLAFISRYYRTKGAASNTLDFIVGFEKEFYSLPRSIEEELLNYSDELFKRGVMLGALIVSYAVLMGYLDGEFLKELYHCGIVANFFLVKGGVSTKEIDSLEDHRQKGLNEGLKGLVEKLKSDEGFEEVIKNKRVKNLLAYCFEKINGKGVPNGLNDNEITDLEALFIFSFNAIPFKSLVSKVGDGESLFLNIEKATCDEFISVRLRKLVESSFEGR